MARDAEVVVLGREIDEQTEHRPTLIAGDFNDVAWSHTTDLFIKLSGLLDPRKGRGLFNTFHADYPLFRFPLDHVFHSNDFRLVALEVLGYVGSDHFPVLPELSHEPPRRSSSPSRMLLPKTRAKPIKRSRALPNTSTTIRSTKIRSRTPDARRRGDPCLHSPVVTLPGAPWPGRREDALHLPGRPAALAG
jgi:hypothetical protein